MPIILTNNQPASNFNPISLTKTAQELQQSLSQIAPDDTKTIKLITFALVSTAILGMFIYHYMKSQEVSH